MIEIPQWLSRLPKNACVNTKEFAQLLGVTPNTLHHRLINGTYSMPIPDFNSRVIQEDKFGRVKKARGYANGKGKNNWKAVTVRNYIRHLNRLELEKNK